MSADRVDLAVLLDRCLERMRQGAGLEECLASCGDRRAEVEPLLSAAAKLEAARVVRPSPEFLDAGEERLRQRIREARQQPVTNRRFLRPLRQTQTADWSQRPRRLPMWSAAAALALVVSLLGGGGLAGASADAVPGEPLYRIKVMVELAQVNMATDEAERSQLRWRFAEVRLTELARLSEGGGEPSLILDTLDAYSDLVMAAMQAADGEDGEQELERWQWHLQVLEQVRARLAEQTPEHAAATAALTRAIENAQRLQERKGEHDDEDEGTGEPGEGRQGPPAEDPSNRQGPPSDHPGRGRGRGNAAPAADEARGRAQTPTPTPDIDDAEASEPEPQQDEQPAATPAPEQGDEQDSDENGGSADAPPHGATPPVVAPPVGVPPTDTPPVAAPPVEAPPIQVPPVDVPDPGPHDGEEQDDEEEDDSAGPSDRPAQGGGSPGR